MVKLATWISLIGIAVTSGTALAEQSSSSDVLVKGSAAKRCVFKSGAVRKGSNNISLTGTGVGGDHVESTVSIIELVDPATAMQKSASIILEYSAICNYAHTLSVSTRYDGLKNISVDDTDVPSFTKLVNYQVFINWVETTRNFVTHGLHPHRVAALATLSPYSGPVTINLIFEPPSNQKPLIEGTYTDTLTIQIGTSL